MCFVARMRHKTHQLFFFKMGGVSCQVDADNRQETYICEGQIPPQRKKVEVTARSRYRLRSLEGWAGGEETTFAIVGAKAMCNRACELLIFCARVDANIVPTVYEVLSSDYLSLTLSKEKKYHTLER